MHFLSRETSLPWCAERSRARAGAQLAGAYRSIRATRWEPRTDSDFERGSYKYEYTCSGSIIKRLDRPMRPAAARGVHPAARNNLRILSLEGGKVKTPLHAADIASARRCWTRYLCGFCQSERHRRFAYPNSFLQVRV